MIARIRSPRRESPSSVVSSQPTSSNSNASVITIQPSNLPTVNIGGAQVCSCCKKVSCACVIYSAGFASGYAAAANFGHCYSGGNSRDKDYTDSPWSRDGTARPLGAFNLDDRFPTV
jgi:hypothetical protein